MNSPALLFPGHAEIRPTWQQKPLDNCLLQEFSAASRSPLNTGDICNGIGRFLHERSGGSVQLSSQFITGLANVLIFILTEVLDRADQFQAYGRGSEMPTGVNPIIIPASIRLAVWVDFDVFDKLRHSSVFWYGRGLDSSTTRDLQGFEEEV